TYSWVSSFDISNKTSQGTPTNQGNFSTGNKYISTNQIIILFQ
ncbi:11160_t:CDS:1, partial [Scutellospora calospora]